MDKKLLSCPHCGGEAEELQRLNRYKAYLDELYGQGLEVVNWHQNGQTEPLDSFLDGAEMELDAGRNLYPIPAVEWVPVSERLPKPFMSVLVYMPGEVPYPTVHEGYISEDGVWMSYMFARELGEVTHWSEMPKLPEGANQI